MRLLRDNAPRGAMAVAWWCMIAVGLGLVIACATVIAVLATVPVILL